MRIIPLRTIEHEDGGPLVYADAIRMVIRQPLDQQKGVSIDEMRKGIRLLDKLDEAKGDTLLLEDADWEHLKAKVQAMTWGMVDRDLLAFIDTVLSAPEASSNGVAQEVRASP